jgi:hypothetical protein
MKTMNLLSGTISPLGPTSIADGIVTTGSVVTSVHIVSTAISVYTKEETYGQGRQQHSPPDQY